MQPVDPYLGIYSSQRLAGLGMSPRDLRRAVADGRLTRIRRGWFAAAGAVPDAVTAVRVGGILTATSAARPLGLWALSDDRVHVLVPRNASRLHLDRAELGIDRGVCVHWAKVRISREVPVADPLQVVVDSDHCQPRVTAVALADSALNRGLLAMEVLEVSLPRLAPWCDPASQSGTESIVRVQLRRHGVKVRTQARIRGVGCVDLLVGDRLVIECDSVAYHDGYQSERDYERDQQLLAQGYLVLRLKYSHVIHEWSRVEALVLEVVRARRHWWRTGSGVAGSALAL
jgi:very-short-patch-repair endonuclease